MFVKDHHGRFSEELKISCNSVESRGFTETSLDKKSRCGNGQESTGTQRKRKAPQGKM